MGYKILCAFVALLAINIAILFSKEEMKEYSEYVRNVLTDLQDIFLSKPTESEGEPGIGKCFTKDELSVYDGEGSGVVMLAVLGKVFDVSKGMRHYGPGGGYHFFAGKDASRAYVSGDFSDAGLIDNVEGLKPHEFIELDNWVKFYEKEYTYVGKLEGYFYNSKGQPTDNFRNAEKMIAKGLSLKEEDDTDKQMYPMCNSEWSQDKGGMVYCSKRSGGIERDWVGVPRLYFRPGIAQPRCACVKSTGPPSDEPDSTDHKDRGDLDHPNFKKYPNCDSMSLSCRLPNS